MFTFKNFKEVLKQIFIKKEFAKVFYFAVIPALLVYSVILISFRSFGFTTVEILRDMPQQLQVSSFLGVLSNIGVWLWVSSGAICLFAIFSAGKEFAYKHKELLFLAAMLSYILAFDDFFMFHERMNQMIPYLSYAIFATVLILRHTKTILIISGPAFLLAITFMALSVITDTIQLRLNINYNKTQIFEEGCKFLGGATWLYFSGQLALSKLVKN